MEASNLAKKLWEASKITGEVLWKSGEWNRRHRKTEKSSEKSW